LYQGLITDRLFALALEGRAAHRADTGFNAPVIYHAMGEGSLACAPGGDLEAYAPVRTSHSNCVLPLSLDRPRALVQDFYVGVAGQNREKVAQALGYDVVDFRKGYLEDVPVDDASVDLVTSNCVINLSPDKPRVFREMWRVLRDHGRIVVSDVVADGPLPPGL